MFCTVEAEEQKEVFCRKAKDRRSGKRNFLKMFPHPHSLKRERKVWGSNSPVQSDNNTEKESAVIAGIQLIVIEYEAIFVILSEISCFLSLSCRKIPEPVFMSKEEVLGLRDVSFGYQDIKVAELPQRHISISS
jgi:hypothetical protein